MILYKRLTFLVTVAIFLLGCSKGFLDRYPKDALPPNAFWQTKKDVALALAGLYNDFEKGQNILYRDCASDNSYNNAVSADAWAYLGNGSLSASTPGATYYNYNTIIRCNEFIRALTGSTIEKIDIDIAQARFIRAYRYYVLTTNYGDVPLVTEVFATPEQAKVPKTPKQKVQDFIEKELIDIIPVLPEKYPDAEYGKATKGAAQALLTRFYLYYGRYDKVLETGKAIKGYALFPDYPGLFKQENEKNGEVIFSVQYTPLLYSMDLTLYFPASVGGRSSIVPTQELVNSFEMADGLTIEEAKANGSYNETNPYRNRDPRLRATVIYPGAIFRGDKIFSSIVGGDADYFNKADHSTKTGYNYRKYVEGFTAATLISDISQDIYIFRYAEILLSMAEAKIELGQIDDELYDLIDQIRVRSGMPETDRSKYNSQTKLRDLIQRERRVEFAGEGLRRDDIIRWKIASNVLNIKLQGVKKGIVLASTQPNGDHNVNLNGIDGNIIETRVFSSRNNLLPFPQTAIDKNPALVQNEGY